MIVEMLQPSSLPWTRLLVATLAGFHNISTQPTFVRSLKLSRKFKSKICPTALAIPRRARRSAEIVYFIVQVLLNVHRDGDDYEFLIFLIKTYKIDQPRSVFDPCVV